MTVASDPRHRPRQHGEGKLPCPGLLGGGIKTRLATQLDSYLAATADPRATGNGQLLDAVMRKYPRERITHLPGRAARSSQSPAD